MPTSMSSDAKDASKAEKKKSRPKLSIKIFKRKTESLRKIGEERPSHGEEATEEVGPTIEKMTPETVKEQQGGRDDRSESDVSDSINIPAFRPNRRRSLSACADFLDTRIAIKVRAATADAETDDSTDGGKEEEVSSDDQLSPLPSSPTRSCLRRRAATISYEGEVVASDDGPRPRAVSFSPDTVDPPPRNMKYRAWIEARTRMPAINVKHEKHKQKNESDEESQHVGLPDISQASLQWTNGYGQLSVLGRWHDDVEPTPSPGHQELLHRDILYSFWELTVVVV